MSPPPNPPPTSTPRPLEALRIGISLSGGPDLHRLGLEADGVNAVTIDLTRRLIALGACVVLGHDWRPGGVMEAVAKFARSYLASHARPSHALVLNCLAAPDRPAVSARDAEDLAGVIDFSTVSWESERAAIANLLDQPPTESGFGAQAIPPLREMLVDESPTNARRRHLLALRAHLAGLCDGRVAMGGPVSVPPDAVPGILEEVWWTLFRGRRAVISDGLGGMARAILSRHTRKAEQVLGDQPHPLAVAYWADLCALLPAETEGRLLTVRGLHADAILQTLTTLRHQDAKPIPADHRIDPGVSLRARTGAGVVAVGAGGRRPIPSQEGTDSPATTPPVVLTIEAVWGDITQAKGDVYCVGHYHGVLPQNAELALDRMVSSTSPSQPPDNDAERNPRLVITEQTRRGTVRGAEGDVNFFPWRTLDRDQPDRVVAVVGMGHPGSFGYSALRRLTRELVLSVNRLPGAQTVCSVLIGTGAGGLSIREAAGSLIEGLADALSLDAGAIQIRLLQIVERDHCRAGKLHQALHQALQAASQPRRRQLHLKPALGKCPGGVRADEDVLRTWQATAANLLANDNQGTPEQRAALKTLLGALAPDLQQPTRDALRRQAAAEPAPAAARREGEPSIPVRISYLEERGELRVAAITHRATVAERRVSVDPGLVNEIAASINDPDKALGPDLPTILLQLFLPRDFRGLLLEDGPFVFEVDRRTAQIHWEILARDGNREPNAPPLGAQAAVARQLRTTYSPPPMDVRRRDGPLRALVVGDPGDPARGEDLPGARREALRVRDILRRHQVEVTTLIGAPNHPCADGATRLPPATRLEVLSRLMHERFDILHYCGHGGFVPDDPARTAGWLFAGGLLTAREIGRLDEVPSLVVANACLSARTSQRLAGGGQTEQLRTEVGLLPSLADEFLHLGVSNYLGTAWEVDDRGAIEFADGFYETLLRPEPRATLGEALRTARRALWDRRHQGRGKLWAAYQHYGDPGSRLT